MRPLVVGMIVLLGGTGLSAGAGAPRAAAATAQTRQAGQEVQTVYTSELGVDRPAGLAYDPSREEFLVAEDDAAATPVLRLGPDAERRGTFTLPELSDPQTLAFNATQNELTAIDGDEAVQVSDAALDTRTPRTERTPIDELQLESPESATFDPQTDTWFVLEEQADAVTVVDGDGAGVPGSVPLPAGDADRVIAFNPDDDLLYVLDAGDDRVDAIDADGDVRKSIDLQATELKDPVAMTFAPSTDSTDDPGNLNLYVADAGSERTLGGVTEFAVAAPVAAAAAPTDTATHVQTIHTSTWTPASPDPTGVVWKEGRDELIVGDSEVDEVTGAGWNNVNLWWSKRNGTVAATGATYGPRAPSDYSREPTGVGYDNGSDILFVSDDDKERIFVVKRGPDGVHGTTDDVVTSITTLANSDTEDPEFDPVSGDLFYLDGVGMEIYRVDPGGDGTFGTGDDTRTNFDISHLGERDFEGLTSNPARRTLYVGARTTEQIYEITHDGTLIRSIDASGVPGIRQISGLAVAPASTGGSNMNLWIVDRAIDNGADPNENDGKMFEISAPNIGTVPGPGNDPPAAADDSASTKAAKSVTVSVLDNDSDPDGDPLTVTNLTQPANGSVRVASGQSVTYTPRAGFAGTDTFTYTANDGSTDSDAARVTVSVAHRSKIVFHRIVYNPRGRDTRTNSHLNKEIVVLRNVGSRGRSLTDWVVRDRANNRYRLPRGFRLEPRAYVRIHTGSGANDSNDLFWGRSRYVWNNGGDRATLINTTRRTRKVRDRCGYEGGGNEIRC